jgi:hypothetical protein
MTKDKIVTVVFWSVIIEINVNIYQYILDSKINNSFLIK